MDGVIRTRVGYCGGTTAHPTYHSIGDHSETIQLDFDPAVISYRQLLEAARRQGSFGGSSWSRQYRSVVFYSSPEQRQEALRMGIRDVEPLGTFTRAEDYHQKYYLQQNSQLVQDFYRRYPDARSFTDSSAVTRANGIAGGFVEAERIQRLIPELGVSPACAQAMLRLAGTSAPGCALP